MFVVLDLGELTSSGAGDPTSSQQRICSLSSLFISWLSSVRMEKGNWSTSEVNGMADAFAYRSVIIPINLPLISKHHPQGEGRPLAVLSYILRTARGESDWSTSMKLAAHADSEGMN